MSRIDATDIIPLLIFTPLLIFALNQHSPEESEMKWLKNLIIKENPKYSEHTYKGEKYKDGILVSFSQYSQIYTIGGYDYKNMYVIDFMSEVKKMDTVDILVYENSIFRILKKENDYCEFKQSQSVNKKEQTWKIIFLGFASLIFWTKFILTIYKKTSTEIEASKGVYFVLSWVIIIVFGFLTNFLLNVFYGV